MAAILDFTYGAVQFPKLCVSHTTMYNREALKGNEEALKGNEETVRGKEGASKSDRMRLWNSDKEA